ncbi:phage tail protein [Pseudoalteromonas sp. MMG006]|uniref:phage tail-collar fiber domain-containing protein n=1 Tax=Pseudoalteromonas sp. MMG006 TaxID=2822683 RepID=UPI001B37B56F|nr:phage tail protein [Pseudoalteromonas sp. MMG006]MBQ4800871.1 phage tail protein [Pseudoalteromonas sp. MMG006]
MTEAVLGIMTNAGTQYIADKTLANQGLEVAEVVLANINSIDENTPRDKDQGLPTALQIVHRRNIDAQGKVDENTVAWSVVLDQNIGDFDYNWIGLVTSDGTLIALDYLPLQRKRAGVNNVHNRSFVLQFAGAAALSQITIPAESWMFDYTPRIDALDQSLKKTVAEFKLDHKNVIVDGRFDFWYEGVSQNSNGYGSDTMWVNEHVGSTKTHTREELTPSVDLPCVDNPTAKYFSRTIVNSVAGHANKVSKMQKIEWVRTLAGKKTTLSFYFKADSNKNIAVELIQNFGTGGTSSAEALAVGSKLIAVTSKWKRYEITIDLPNLIGKSIGTDSNDWLGLRFWFDAGSHYNKYAGFLGQQSGVFDLACVQLEEGNEATKFKEEQFSKSSIIIGRYYELIRLDERRKSTVESSYVSTATVVKKRNISALSINNIKGAISFNDTFIAEELNTFQYRVDIWATESGWSSWFRTDITMDSRL